MGNYEIIDVFLLLGIAQGLFLSITLPIIHQKNSAANKVLAWQLLVACLILLTRLSLYKANELWLFQRLTTLEFLIFILGPLGYIYLKRLLEHGHILIWEEADDPDSGSWVVAYDITRNATLIHRSFGTKFVFDGTPGTYRIRAVNASGTLGEPTTFMVHK